MKRLKDILREIESSNPVFAKKWHEAEALTRWQEAVGNVICKHTEVIKVENQILWVAVDHPAWKTELHYRKKQILDLLNSGNHKLLFDDIRLIETRALRRPKAYAEKNNKKE